MEEENKVSSAPESPETTKKKFPVKVLVIIIAFLVFALVSYLVFLDSSKNISQEKVEISPTIFEEIEQNEILTVTPGQTTTPKPTEALLPTSTTAPTSTNTPTPQPKADLYISEYSYSPAPTPIKGEEFSVRIGIYNQGNLASGPFYWEWWPTAYNYACRERIDNIAARGGRIVTCTYTYGGWSNYTVKAVVDADGEVDESSETNNIRSENLVPIH